MLILSEFSRAWNKYILLDSLVCSMAGYFYESCSILTSPKGESKYTGRVKISAILHTKLSNKWFIIQSFICEKIKLNTATRAAKQVFWSTNIAQNVQYGWIFVLAPDPLMVLFVRLFVQLDNKSGYITRREALTYISTASHRLWGDSCSSTYRNNG